MTEVLEFTGAAAQLAEEMARPILLEPGIYTDLSMSTYLALPYVSAGALRALMRSPAHGRAYVEQPDTPAADDSIATIIGTALHTALIEPDSFPHLYVRGPSGNWSHKAPKDEVAAMRAAYPGALVLKPGKYDAVLQARDALLGNPAVASIMAATTAREVSIVWDDPVTLVRCKARPDMLAWGDVVVDLKTTIDASAAGFARAIANFGYDTKAAFYCDGLMEIMSSRYESFAFIAAEVYEPYASAVYQLDPASIESARKQIQRLLRIWAECQANDDWPGFPEEIRFIATPEWRISQLEAVNAG